MLLRASVAAGAVRVAHLAVQQVADQLVGPITTMVAGVV